MKKVIGKVTAIVEFDLLEGDVDTGSYDWFEYREPGISDKSTLGVTIRKCRLVATPKVEKSE